MGNSARWTESVTVREIPQARLSAMAWLVLVLVTTGVAAWEWKMRSLGLLAGDFNDGKQAWAVERRKLEAGDHDGVVIVGGSRILFDTDLDVWKEMTGKRPVQLAMPGWNGQPVSRTSPTTRASTASSCSTLRRRSSSARAAAGTRCLRASSITGAKRARRSVRATRSPGFSSVTSHSWIACIP
jgi:hypothetical protein